MAHRYENITIKQIEAVTWKEKSWAAKPEIFEMPLRGITA